MLRISFNSLKIYLIYNFISCAAHHHLQRSDNDQSMNSTRCHDRIDERHAAYATIIIIVQVLR